VRGHDDQIGFVLFGCGNDGVGHHIRFDRDGLGAHSFGFGRFFDGCQLCLRRIGPLGFHPGNLFRRQWDAALKVGLWVAGNDLERDQLCATGGGQFNGAGHGFFGQSRAIGGHEDAFVHELLLTSLMKVQLKRAANVPT
jgi:hypothetical protein